MKRKDWFCPECGKVMIKTSELYMSCWLEHTTLHRRWRMGNLPAATRVDYMRFTITDEEGFWKYVPHSHNSCLDRSPEPGHIVAKVERVYGLTRSYQAMTFERADPPRNKK